VARRGSFYYLSTLMSRESFNKNRKQAHHPKRVAGPLISQQSQEDRLLASSLRPLKRPLTNFISSSYANTYAANCEGVSGVTALVVVDPLELSI
jgi:hypothetical protein